MMPGEGGFIYTGVASGKDKYTTFSVQDGETGVSKSKETMVSRGATVGTCRVAVMIEKGRSIREGEMSWFPCARGRSARRVQGSTMVSSWRISQPGGVFGQELEAITCTALRPQHELALERGS